MLKNQPNKELIIIKNNIVEAKEFRIGNLVLTNNVEYRKLDAGKIACIVAIDSERNFAELKETVKIYHIEDKYKDTYGQWIKHLKLIPLTEEWLLKFGFLRHHLDYTNGVIYIKNVPGTNEFEWGVFPNELGSGIQIKNRIKLKYVHQLQNLYFALTGKELEYENN